MTMIPWKTFKGKRKLCLASLLVTQNFATYEQVVAYFHDLHVVAPSLEEYNKAASSISTEEQPSKKTDVATSAVKKAPVASQASKDNSGEMWQDGLEGSYQTKKPAAKKSTPTRKSKVTTKTRKKS